MKGVSFNQVESALWDELRTLVQEDGLVYDVYREQDPRNLEGLAECDARVGISKVNVQNIKGKLENREIVDEGDEVTIEFDGEECAGPGNYTYYEKEVWVRARYQIRYIAKTPALDMAFSTALLKFYPRGFIVIRGEGDDFCRLFVRQASSLVGISDIKETGVFERSMDFLIDIPLPVEAAGAVPAITSFVIDIQVQNITDE